MKITNFGGATAVLEHNGKRMLFDPWLNDGIFHGSWYHYPPLNVGIKEVGHLDYIYISHIHEDHCAAGTIKHLNKDAEIILMDRQPNYVAKFLEANQFHFKKIHQIKPRTPTTIASGLIVDMVTADPAHELNYLIDSGLLLNWDGFVLYNANDCPPYEDGLRYIQRTYKKIDLALLPYAGGSGYPACYVNLTDEQKKEEKNRINKQGFEMFVDPLKILKPIHVMPFADQYVIAGSRSHLNKFMAHPPSPAVVRNEIGDLASRVDLILLNSGQTFDFSANRKIPDEPYHVFTEEDRERYIQESLLDKKYDHEAFELNASVPVDRVVAAARGRLWKVQQKENYFPNFSYYVEMHDQKRRFRIQMNTEKIEEASWEAPLVQPYLKVSGSSTLMVLILIGHISWNIADAALFIDYERVPNVYDTKIHAFINYLRI